MYFHMGFIETILFETWTTKSIQRNTFKMNLFNIFFTVFFLVFIASWIFIFILGILYEGIREFRQYLEEEQLIKKPTSVSN